MIYMVIFIISTIFMTFIILLWYLIYSKDKIMCTVAKKFSYIYPTRKMLSDLQSVARKEFLIYQQDIDQLCMTKNDMPARTYDLEP